MAKSKELQTVVSFAGKVDPSLTSAALKAGKQMQKMQQSMKKVGTNVLKGFGSAVKGIGVGVIATATAAAVAIGGMAVQGLSLASDLAEVQNVVQTTFKGSEGAINDFASTALNKFGITELNAKQFSGTLGAMFKSMGVGDEQMLAMSTNLSALSGDMASFYNLDTTEAFDKIRAGISGETEPLKQLGINMSVDNLEEFAKAQGESKKFADMSQAEQAMLRYGFLMKATADAQGDFNKTSDGYANQQRLLGENFKQLTGRVMQGVLPALASGMKVVNEFMSGFDITPLTNLASTVGDVIVQSLPLVNQFLPTLTSILSQIAPLFAGLLQSLMPVVSSILPILANLLVMILPFFVQLAQTLLPIVAILLQAFSEALAPLMPLITELLVVITPILTALAHIVGFVMKLAAFFVGGIIQDLINFFSIFGGGKKKKEATDSMAAYANGGFATRASIFGEAGLEAAIPIKPGNPRSLALLMKTAQMLGINAIPPQIKPLGSSRNSTYVFEYKPQINGNAGDVEPILKRGFNQAKQMFEEWIDERERVCYE